MTYNKPSSKIKRGGSNKRAKKAEELKQSAPTEETHKASSPIIQEVSSVDLKRNYDELHKFREFVRICDLRENLDWPRETFDEMIRTLRDNRTIRIMRADHSVLTETQWQNSFIDENNFVMGTMIWQGYGPRNVTIPIRR